jgi:hypothetical protein
MFKKSVFFIFQTIFITSSLSLFGMESTEEELKKEFEIKKAIAKKEVEAFRKITGRGEKKGLLEEKIVREGKIPVSEFYDSYIDHIENIDSIPVLKMIKKSLLHDTKSLNVDDRHKKEELLNKIQTKIIKIEMIYRLRSTPGISEPEKLPVKAAPKIPTRPSSFAFRKEELELGLAKPTARPLGGVSVMPSVMPSEVEELPKPRPKTTFPARITEPVKEVSQEEEPVEIKPIRKSQILGFESKKAKMTQPRRRRTVDISKAFSEFE